MIAALKDKTMPTFRAKTPNHFDLPRRINRLGELAYNLWWTWNPNAQRLFNRIDNALWERLNHNPLLFLQQIGHAGTLDPARGLCQRPLKAPRQIDGKPTGAE